MPIATRLAALRVAKASNPYVESAIGWRWSGYSGGDHIIIAPSGRTWLVDIVIDRASLLVGGTLALPEEFTS